MKKLIQFPKIFLAQLCLFVILMLPYCAFAQQYCSISGPDGFFTYQDTQNNGLSITVVAKNKNTNHTWHITNSNGVVATGSSNKETFNVPIWGQYQIQHNLGFFTSSPQICTLILGSIQPPPPLGFFDVQYIPNIKPSDNINIPIKTDLAVGAIKGANSVSLSGSATYSVPVSLPSGTKGVEPSLSLDYNSQGGVGMMGMGWNFAALSSITRTAKDYYNDNSIAAPKLDISDVYALDGNRLVLETANSPAFGSSIFRTKNETFSNVVGVGNGNQFNEYDYFLVETKNGMKMYYGLLSNSKYKDNKGQAVGYYLSKVQDANGNYMEYNYTKQNDAILLTEIKYTGNENARVHNKFTCF